MPCGLWIRVGSRYHVLWTEVQIPHAEGQFLRGKRYLHGKWLAERARSTVLLQRNRSFGEMLDQVRFSCRRLCIKAREYDVHMPWLTVSVYEPFKRPSCTPSYSRWICKYFLVRAGIVGNIRNEVDATRSIANRSRRLINSSARRRNTTRKASTPQPTSLLTRHLTTDVATVLVWGVLLGGLSSPRLNLTFCNFLHFDADDMLKLHSSSLIYGRPYVVMAGHYVLLLRFIIN